MHSSHSKAILTDNFILVGIIILKGIQIFLKSITFSPLNRMPNFKRIFERLQIAFATAINLVRSKCSRNLKPNDIFTINHRQANWENINALALTCWRIRLHADRIPIGKILVFDRNAAPIAATTITPTTVVSCYVHIKKCIPQRNTARSVTCLNIHTMNKIEVIRRKTSQTHLACTLWFYFWFIRF